MKKDGSFRIFDGIGKSVVDPSGRIMLVANAHDVTDRRRAEETLRQREEFYHIIAEAARDMIFIIDENDMIEYVNTYGAEQFRKKPADLIGKPRDAVFPSFVSRRQKDSLRKVFDSGVPLYMANEIPFPKGKMVLDTWLVPIKNDSGKVKSVFGISRDVTAARVAQEELEKKTKESEVQKLRAQLYFDFLAHDIANIVSPILTYAETIQGNPNVPPDIMGYTSKIAEQAKQMASFILNLRMLAEAEKVAPEDADTLDLRSLLMDLNKVIQNDDHKSMKVSFDVPSDGRIDVIGGMHIKNAFMLGLSRSMRRVSRDETHVEVKVLPVKKSGGKSFWQIRIEVLGVQLTPEAKESLATPFDPERRFKRKAANEISFATSIIEHFGGRLWAEDLSPSNPSRGHAIIIELPKVNGWSSGHST